MATFAERLIKLRKEKGLTQKELAAKVDISVASIISWENGRRERPRFKAAVVLAGYFGVSIKYLIGEDFFRTDEEHSTIAVWEGDLSGVIKEEVEDLSFDDKIVIFDAIQELKKKHLASASMTGK